MSEQTTMLTVRIKSGSLDDIPLGILRLSDDDRVDYLNRAAQELAGPELAVGMPLGVLHFEGSSEEMLQNEIKERRRTERGSSYPLTLARPDLGTPVHLQVSGIPEYDEQGKLVGSLGFISDVTMQRANLNIHEAIGIACDWRSLLRALDEHLREVLAFDSILVSLISEDRSSIRVFYERPARQAPAVPAMRWWPMPAFVQADLAQLLSTRADDVRVMFESESYRELAMNDADTVAWLQLGHRHMLRRPVMRNGQLVSVVTLLRAQDQPFNARDIERLEQLPLGEAVNMALALDSQNELRFGLEVIGRMGAVAGSIPEVARVLVNELRRYFEWDHVSLFRVNTDENAVSIVDQSSVADFRLRDRFSQSIDDGLLGHVARSGQPVIENDVAKSRTYCEGIPGSKSEMCLPVPGRPVRWILNVESTLRGAFATADQAAVAQLLEVAGLILDRTLALEFNATVLESVADAVIQTTSKGEIQYVNPAGMKLLGRSMDTLMGTHLSALVSATGNEPDPPSFAAHLIEVESLQPIEVELRPATGVPIPVLLSGESLPPEIGGRVYVASDLRFRQEVQRMDSLQHVFRQVASETRLPVALSSAYLKELAQTQLDADAAELVDRALRRLRQADLPLERLVRLAAAQEGQELLLHPLSLSNFARDLVEQLPRTLGKTLAVEVGSGVQLALAAQPELEFCALSLLSFLLRMKAQSDRVRVSVSGEVGRQLLVFEPIGAVAGPSATRMPPRSEYEREFTLIEPIIRALMRRMRGSLEVRQAEGLRFCLALSEEAT